MNFSKSFNELKKPIVWLHYAIGTILLYLVYTYVLGKQFLSGDMVAALFTFYLIYVAVDRTVHGILDI